MGETPDEIETHIRETRDDLNANLNELEYKVKAVTDWRQQYQKSPGTFLAVALGGGVLLALMTRGRRSAAPAAVIMAPAATGPERPEPAAPRPKPPREIDHSISALKSALIGVVTSQARGFLSRVVPGFEEQLADHARKTPQPTPDKVGAQAGDGYRNGTNGESEDKEGPAEQHSGGDYATHQ